MIDSNFGGFPKQIRSMCKGVHSFVWVTSDYLFYEKGNRERLWFRGRYGECENFGCDETSFVGNRQAYFQDKAGDPGPDNIMIKYQKETEQNARENNRSELEG